MSYGILLKSNIVDIDQASYTITNESIGTIFFINAVRSTTVTLPAVSASLKGIYYTFKRNGGAYNVTIDGDGSETIDGSTTKNISSTWRSWKIMCTGTQWITIDYGVQ